MAGLGRSLRTCATLSLIGLLAACASNPPQPQPSATGGGNAPVSRSDGSEPRSERGNPPFYDVLGKRYHVLPSSSGYVARGIASWYGRDFHGLATSSGETYNMNAMTAAHTTLPLPTWVEVTNLVNGKRVVVKVNDRGPFVDDRLIDLSYAAATQLDMVRTGTTRVEVRAIPAPGANQRETTVAAATEILAAPQPAAGAASASVERMFVQVGAFSQQDNAEKLVARLRASGFSNPTVVSESDQRRMHRVWLGPIRDSQEFDALNARLRAIGVSGSRLVVDNTP
jgi:rare lipoprotein A